MGKPITDLSSVTTVGLDLAKHVFHVHGVDASGRVIVSKALRRKDVLVFFAQMPPCLVGVEACGSAHHWGRELIKLGHDVRIMPAAYVKPYVRRQKNDAADAAGKGLRCALSACVRWRTRRRSCITRRARCWWRNARN